MATFSNITAFKIVTTVALLSAISACDKASDEVNDEAAPTVVFTTPADLTTDISRSGSVTVEFSEAILSSSIDTFSFTLQSPTEFLATSVSLADDTATLTPTNTLNFLTSYTATLSSSISHSADNSMAADVSWSFTTEDGTWGTAELIETDDAGRAYDPKITFDNNGNAFAVWNQSDGTWNNIWANRYTAGSGWGTAELIETENAGHALSPHLAFNSDGNAIVVWYQDDGSDRNIWALYYTVGSGWGTAEKIETNTGSDANHPQIAIDANGNALVVWYQDDSTYNNIWANRYTVGSGWGTAVLIETENAGSAYDPKIAMDKDGNAIAVWKQSSGSRNDIWANRYTFGTGWGTAVLIEDDTSSANSQQIAIDSDGNALAVWTQADGVWANFYTAGSGWGTAELIETEDGDTDDPQIAFDSNGNALAVWSQYDGDNDRIWSNRYTFGTGWGNPGLIEVGTTYAYEPQIAIDSNANALTVWTVDDGSNEKIWTNRYIAGNGWGNAELIEVADTGSPYELNIAFDNNDNAMSVWTQSDNIMANRFE